MHSWIKTGKVYETNSLWICCNFDFITHTQCNYYKIYVQYLLTLGKITILVIGRYRPTTSYHPDCAQHFVPKSFLEIVWLNGSLVWSSDTVIGSRLSFRMCSCETEQEVCNGGWNYCFLCIFLPCHYLNVPRLTNMNSFESIWNVLRTITDSNSYNLQAIDIRYRSLNRL
jgi:hypothetical protein